MKLNHSFPSVRTVIDLGASDGRWSDKNSACFPNAERFLLVEPLGYPRLFDSLKHLWEQVAVSGPEQAGLTAAFTCAPDMFGSGLYGHEPTAKDTILLKTTTVDLLVKKHNLQPPFFIKTDIHGAESAALDGASNTLRKSEGLALELYNFPQELGPKAQHWLDVCLRLREMGFRVLDIPDIMRRPKDSALWQLDILFAPIKREEFNTINYC